MLLLNFSWCIFSQKFRACRRLKPGGLSRQWQAFPPPPHPNQFGVGGRTAGTILGFLCCLCAIVVVAHRVVVIVVVVAIMLSCALEFVVSFFLLALSTLDSILCFGQQSTVLRVCLWCGCYFVFICWLYACSFVYLFVVFACLLIRWFVCCHCFICLFIRYFHCYLFGFVGLHCSSLSVHLCHLPQEVHQQYTLYLHLGLARSLHN